MAIANFQTINLEPTPNQRQVVTLDGSEYVVKFRWRERSEAWYVSIYTYPEEDTIIEGRRLRKYTNVVSIVNDDVLDGFFGYVGPDFPSFDDPDAEPFYLHFTSSE